MIRILILTSSTGGGHDSRARAFVAWIEHLYSNTVDTRVESMLEHSSRIAAFGVWFYNFIQKYAPWFHVPYFLLVEGLSFLGSKKVSLGRVYYEKVVTEFKPHLVFSVHDCLNRGYFYTARKLLGEDNVRCATYCSEFYGGFGYSRNWVDRSVDLYISRTQEAQNYAVDRLGLPLEKSKIYGQFLEPRAYESQMSESEKYSDLTENLDLDASRKTILLATGGAGANNHIEVLRALGSFGYEYQAIVICGRNAKTFEVVNDWATENPNFRCHVVGYTDEVYRFMQLSDFVLTRGGTTSCSEALHFGTQIIFNGIGGVMPQESLTLKYFMKSGAATSIRDPNELTELLARWCRYPQERIDMSERFRTLRCTGEPSEGPRHLFSLAESAMEGRG